MARNIAILSCTIGAATPGASGDLLDDVLALIPDDIEMFIAIGSLRAANDELQQMLEGMDRAEMVLGARPIDQIKSMFGVSVALNELAGGAMVCFSHEHERGAAWILPAIDAEAFLSGNFEAVVDHADLPCDSIRMFEHRLFGRVAVRTLDGHVVLATDPAWLCAYQPGEGIRSRIDALAERRLDAFASNGDVLIFARGESIAPLIIRASRLASAASERPSDSERIATAVDRLPIEQGLLALDFDPLALFVRSMVEVAQDHPLAEKVRAAQPRGRGMQALPDRPYFLALSADIDGLGGETALGALQHAFGESTLLAILRELRCSHASLFAEHIGRSEGGLLQEGSALLTVDDPARAMAAFRQFVADGRVGEHSAWGEASELPGVGRFETFTLRLRGDDPLAAMMLGVLFGRPMLEGGAVATGDALVVTFSRGRAVLEDAVGRIDGADPTLNRNMVVRSMRGFLPASPQLELFIDASRAAAALQPLIDMWSRATGARVRTLPAGLPPIAYAAATRRHGYEHRLIVPTGILAGLADQALDPFIRRGDTRADREDGDHDAAP